MHADGSPEGSKLPARRNTGLPTMHVLSSAAAGAQSARALGQPFIVNVPRLRHRAAHVVALDHVPCRRRSMDSGLGGEPIERSATGAHRPSTVTDQPGIRNPDLCAILHTVLYSALLLSRVYALRRSNQDASERVSVVYATSTVTDSNRRNL